MQSQYVECKRTDFRPLLYVQVHSKSSDSRIRWDSGVGFLYAADDRETGEELSKQMWPAVGNFTSYQQDEKPPTEIWKTLFFKVQSQMSDRHLMTA